ncbi:MAG: phage major capsid protein [Candidatus Dormibacteria bacterium]
MPLTLSNADAALKEFYEPAIREQINQAVMMLMQIEKNSSDIEGRRAVLSLHVSRNSGVGARADGAALPIAGNQGYAEERVPLKFNYGRIQLTGPTIRAMRSDRGSFTRAIDSETKGVTNDLRRDVNRQVFGTGDGVIALFAANAALNVLVLQATVTKVQLRQLEVGMLIDIGTPTTPTLDATERTITNVNTATPSITVSGAPVTTSNGDAAFRFGAGGNAPQLEISGLQKIVASSGVLFNVDPAVQPLWVSQVFANGGVLRTFTENLAAQAMHTVKIAGGEDLNLWVTSDGVFRSYSNNLTSLKRFPNELTLRGGFKALSITAGGGEVGLIWDRDAPNNKAWGINTDHLIQFQMSDWEFMQEDGAVLSRVPGFDNYEAVLFKYHELCTDKRNAHALVSDLIES